MVNVQNVKKYLEDNHIDADLIEHPDKDAKTSDDAAKVCGTDTAHIIKTLLFVDNSNNYAIVMIQGNKKVDEKKIPDMKKPQMATAAQIKEILGTEPGGISPVALPEELKKYIDVGLTSLDKIFVSGGSRYATIKMKPEQLLKQPNCLVMDLAKE